jgi:hypothetical protein
MADAVFLRRKVNMNKQTINSKPMMRDPRDQNREVYNPLFSGPEKEAPVREPADPLPVTPPYKMPPSRDDENKDETEN